MWSAVAVTLLAAALSADVRGGGGQPFNPFDLEWWQTLGVIVAATGLSPAPWILGLAIGRIQFTKAADAAHERELKAREETNELLMQVKDQRYADLEAANQRTIEVAEVQRQRADAMTDALSQSTDALLVTNHILTEFTRAAKEVTSDGEPKP